MSTAVVVAAVILVLAIVCLVLLWPRLWLLLCPPPDPKPQPCFRTRSRGNYGFVSGGLDDEEGLLSNIGILMDTYHVTDVQFYDWFPNYSGVYQAFDNQTSPGIKAFPDWWKGESWKEAWFGQRTIIAGTLRKAVALVAHKGGRPWAYVQAQGSEFFNLAGPPWGCTDVHSLSDAGWSVATLDPQVVSRSSTSDPDKPPFPVFDTRFDPNPVLAKLQGPATTAGSGTWLCQTGGTRVVPTYFLNSALGAYQCNAWVEIVKSFGFAGIHWDTMKTPPDAASSPAWQAGALDFLHEAGAILSRSNLLQTFNDINLSFGVTGKSQLFGPGALLQFQYSEVWSSLDEQAYYAVGMPGGVIANYPGGANGCCQPPESQCKPCPEHMTQEQLAEMRYKTGICHGLRYVLVGCGVLQTSQSKSFLGRLINEYFPVVTEMSPTTGGIVQNCAAAAAAD